MTLSRVQVSLDGTRDYEVLVGHSLTGTLADRVRALCPNAARAFIVIDDGLPELARANLASALSRRQFATAGITIRPSEPDKSLETLDRVLVAIAESRHERRDPVIALGGGIVGDVAGFAAATYRRGVPVIQCPTTLLSMVDASVGGKTGVNLRTPDGSLKKNLVGAFHQPRLVVADISLLSSLPDRQLRAGMAECVKHALLSGQFGDPTLLPWIESSAPAILSRDSGTLAELVSRNVAIKARVVAGDEREEAESIVGGRALLNLGHTFGHAIETLPNLSPTGQPTDAPLHHGEAVALGIMAALETAVSYRVASPSLRDRVGSLLSRLGLPTKVRGLPPSDRVLELMGHDKKVQGGVLRLVLPHDGGVCIVKDNPSLAIVLGAIDSIRV
ncbi:MAG: 3-dehydroquinate synthase [Phycisphaerae bacterium]|nr:3-dehydroquinate synthase [Phycisphaerae bacterium]